jgi:hypothetical protein
VYSVLQRDKNGEDIDLDELVELLDKVNPIHLADHTEYQQQLSELYERKLEAKFSEVYLKRRRQEKKENEYEDDTPLPTPEDEQEESYYKQLYLDLLAKIEKGEVTLKNKELIDNSELSAEKKQELYDKITE